jgi:hypothetical protein
MRAQSLRREYAPSTVIFLDRLTVVGNQARVIAVHRLRYVDRTPYFDSHAVEDYRTSDVWMPTRSGWKLIKSKDLPDGTQTLDGETFPRDLQGIGRLMHVSYGNGKSEWQLIPTPDYVQANGLDKLGDYIKRVAESQSEHASLIVSWNGGRHANLITRANGIIYDSESIQVLPQNDPVLRLENDIRAFYEDLSIVPVRDALHNSNGVPDSRRTLLYPLGSDCAEVTQVIRAKLQNVYGVSNSAGLKFTFTERDRP